MRLAIDLVEVSMAVVVQRFIPVSISGILFTAIPLDGDRNQMLINATWGLGEAIASGQVTPDTVIVDKSDLQILSRESMTKMIWRTGCQTFSLRLRNKPPLLGSVRHFSPWLPGRLLSWLCGGGEIADDDQVDSHVFVTIMI
jgi:hypothetical protein